LLRETGTPEYREQPYNTQYVVPLGPHASSFRDVYSDAEYGFLNAFSYQAYPVVYKFPDAAAIYTVTPRGVALLL
jgi:hypothetical protein